MMDWNTIINIFCILAIVSVMVLPGIILRISKRKIPSNGFDSKFPSLGNFESTSFNNIKKTKVFKRRLFFNRIEPYLFCLARCCGLFLRFFFRFNMSPRTLCLLDSLSFKLMKYQKVLFQSFLVSLVSGIGGVCWFYPDVNVKIVMAVPMILFLLLVLETLFLLWNSMVNH